MFLPRTHRKEPESSNFPVLWREIKSPVRRALHDALCWMPDTRWVLCKILGSCGTLLAVLLLKDCHPVQSRSIHEIVKHLEEKYYCEEFLQCLFRECQFTV